MAIFEQDFIMREVEIIARFLAKGLFGKDLDNEEAEEYINTLSEEYLPYSLRELLDDGKINEAENLLFEKIEEEPRMEYLSAAVEFYKTLGQMDPRYLRQCGFSEEEVADGLSEIKRIYKIES